MQLSLPWFIVSYRRQSKSIIFCKLTVHYTSQNHREVSQDDINMSINAALLFSKQFETGCPEKFWMPHPQRCSGTGWMGPWAPWSGIRYAGLWTCMQQMSWNLMILEVPSNPSHSMILSDTKSTVTPFDRGNSQLQNTNLSTQSPPLAMHFHQ